MTGVLTDEAPPSAHAVPDERGRLARAGRALDRRVFAILALLTALGGLWRFASFGFNIWPHGDVVLDAAIAESVAWRGRLLVPLVDVRYYPIDRFGFGYPPDQHPPLWPLLGVPLVWLTGDGYVALKVVSLLVGIAVIPLAYLSLRRHVGDGPALFASGLAAASYPLVDFSGNGSLWGLLAALYLGWLWALPGTAEGGSAARTRAGWALVGLVMGLAYLTNYPAVVLPVALAALHLLRHGRAALRPSLLAEPALAGLVLLVVVLPWLVHNALLFGSPIWSQPFQRTLAGGSRQVEYVIVGDEVVKRNLPAQGSRLAGLRERALDLYGNVGFVLKQSLMLTPVLGGLFAVGLLLVPWRRRAARAWADEAAATGASVARAASPEAAIRPPAARPALAGPSAPAPEPCPSAAASAGLAPDPRPVAVLALVHLALILWWPTTKFRYLIPLLPLVLALGAWCLWQVGPAALRARLALVVAGLCLFTNLWTMLSIPSRTYYYDGGLVPDNFGQQGERLFVEEARRFRAAADAIVARGPGVVLGDHILAPFTRMPLVVNSTGYPPEVVAHLVRKYGIRYVVADRAHAEAYAFLRPTALWSDDRLVVLELPAGGA